jgi:hypothetical protein
MAHDRFNRTALVPIASARWRRSQIAETVATYRASPPCYRLPKDVFFVAIVESETELREVQRQIFLADVVVGADDSALEQGPEGINAGRVNPFSFRGGSMEPTH